MTFAMLYTMFFFLMDGDKLLYKILYYLPLKDRDEQRMLEKFTSVTRATLKGMAIIGILQGGLAGIAFWVVGIPSAVFWGTIMAALCIIPGIGTALVWGPAVVILAAGGKHSIHT
jgi:predicted PurR-regulated permease PerM